LYGVEVLVTVNTLLTDEELPQAVALAWELYEAGVDALIIQDLRLLKENLPPIRLHASTQCDNRTISHIQELEHLGFRRVVLARELGIDEIAAIRRQTTIELEAFVHGALCVSYSGRCYLSEVMMNRSANRGCCAQMCRQPYDLLDENGLEVLDDEGKPIHQRYLLSLQDMDRSLALRDMIQAGVTTFKIEGRLKDADYVTNVVAYYRQKLDELISQMTLESASYESTYHYSFRPNPEKTFHRGGTDYFLYGRTDKMASWSTPKSTGEYVGVVTRVGGKSIHIALLPHVELHNGDGLCCGDKGFAVNGVEGTRILLNQKVDVHVGDAVYRNKDVEFERTLHAERRVLVRMGIRETAEGFTLWLEHPNKRVEMLVYFPHEPAKNPERAIQTLREQLSKLGDTPYQAREIIVESTPYFIPISQLNQWRRDLLQQL